MTSDPPASDRDPSSGPGERSEELFDRWRAAGEESAARRLTGRYQSRLARLIQRRLPPDVRRRFETEDLVQETLARTVQKAEGFEDRGPGSLWAWVRGITTHVLHDAWRRNARDRPADVDIDDSRAHPETPEDSPFVRLLGDERGRLILAALGKLRERERKAVLLHCEMGLGYAAVARALEYPSTDAARMAVRRALDQVGEELAEMTRA